MILCCGEALIDMIPARASDGAVSYSPHPGGAVFNTAIALGRLGASVSLFSGVSTDPFGELLVSALTASGVRTDLLARSDRPTTLAMVHLKDGAASYSFYDEGSAGRMLHPEDAPDLPNDVSTLFFGGISLVSEPAAETYAGILDRWRDGRTVMLDPNIRPGLIEDAPRYRDRLVRMVARADIVKMSEEDLAWFDPHASADIAARSLLQSGPKIVVLTKAETGATAITADGEIHVPAFEVACVDTVGAGDTFNAGLLFELEQRGLLRTLAEQAPANADLAAGLETGAKAAAIACTRAGANPPTLAELEAFFTGSPRSPKSA